MPGKDKDKQPDTLLVKQTENSQVDFENDFENDVANMITLSEKMHIAVVM